MAAIKMFHKTNEFLFLQWTPAIAKHRKNMTSIQALQYTCEQNDTLTYRQVRKNTQ